MKPLEHLLDPEFEDIDDMDASDLMGAQATAASFMPTTEIIREDAAASARAAFAAATSPSLSDAEKKKALLTVRVPEAVRHLSGMLTQYDWEFVDQAKELRGYVVAKLLEESKHPDAKIRLRAIELLGKLTEVGSFTERVEVKKVDATNDEIISSIKGKLAALLPRVVEVETVTPKE